MKETQAIAADKQQDYLCLLAQARNINDRCLVRLILKRLSGIQAPAPVCRPHGSGDVICFPLMPAADVSRPPGPPMWWMLIKMTLLIPGSFIALMLLAIFRM